MRSTRVFLGLRGIAPLAAASCVLAGCFSSAAKSPDASSPSEGEAGDAAGDGPFTDAWTEGRAADVSQTDAPADASAETRDAGVDSTVDAATGTDAPADRAADTESGAVDACASCNGTCTTGRCIELLSSGVGNVTGLAVDATYVYWCTGGGMVLKAPLAGVPDGGEPTVLATGINFPNAVAVDANAVYVADYSDGLILSIPLTGLPDGGTPTTLVSGLGSPAGVAVDSTTIYITGNDGTVRTAPLAGGTPTLFTSDGSQPNGAWLLGGSLYWIDLSGGAIKVVPTTGVPDGSIPTTVLTVGGTPHHVAADPNSIYWLDGTNGIIESAPTTGLPDGGAPTPIASGQNAPDGLAIDSAWVYWGDNGGTGQIFRASKAFNPEDGGSSGGAADAGYSCPDASADASADPVSGVWVGTQGSATWTVYIEAGNVTASSADDSCTGTYLVTGSATASSTWMCVPLTSAGSIPHTDTGTLTVSGTMLTYDYNYGPGTNSFTASRVCP